MIYKKNFKNYPVYLTVISSHTKLKFRFYTASIIINNPLILAFSNEMGQYLDSNKIFINDDMWFNTIDLNTSDKIRNYFANHHNIVNATLRINSFEDLVSLFNDFKSILICKNYQEYLSILRKAKILKILDNDISS